MLQASLPLAVRERAAPAVQVGVAAAVAAAAGVVVADSTSLAITGAVLGAVALGAFGLSWPAAFVAIIVFARPLLDETSYTSIGPTNPAGITAAVIVGLALLLLITKPRALKPPALGAFTVVIAVTLIGAAIARETVGSVMGSDPVAETVRIAALGALYFLGANFFATEQRARRIFVLIALSGVPAAIWGLIEDLTGSADQFEQSIQAYRISGPFSGPVPYGMFLAMSALLLIGMPRRWLPLWVRVTALVPVLLALVDSYSRSGWAAFVIGLVFVSLWGNKWLLPVGATCIVAVMVIAPSFQDRALGKADYTAEEQTYGSYRWRIDNWSDLLSQAAERPVFGYGIATTTYINTRRPASSDLADPGGGFEAHNTAVRLLVEGGAVLFLAWLGFLLMVAKGLRPLVRRSHPLHGAARLVASLWIAYVLVGAASDDPLEVTAIMFGLFLLTGAVEGAGRVRRPPTPREDFRPKRTGARILSARPMGKAHA